MITSTVNTSSIVGLRGGRDPRRVLQFPSQLLPACPQGKEAESPRGNQRASLPTYPGSWIPTVPHCIFCPAAAGDDHWQVDDSHLRRRVCMRGGELHAHNTKSALWSKQSGRQVGRPRGQKLRMSTSLPSNRTSQIPINSHFLQRSRWAGGQAGHVFTAEREPKAWQGSFLFRQHRHTQVQMHQPIGTQHRVCLSPACQGV